MSAIRSGDTAVDAAEINTTHVTEIRLTKYPVVMLLKTAVIRAGRIRNEVSSAVWPWTSWKL
jgi:hypothetical protein